MIDRKSRRVVILNNIQSDTIDQAIFILKTNHGDKRTTKNDTDIAFEAQCIINNYVRQVENYKRSASDKTPSGHKSKWVRLLLGATVLLLSAYLLLQIS